MSQTNLDTKTRTGVKRPKKYTVVFLNDDFTPIEFVIDVLTRYFKLSADEAAVISTNIHKTGKGNAGLFTHEVAEYKVDQVMNDARHYEHPLTCAVEQG
jgi:ATP-dependent Clp protease adaptor protein ClpS